MNNKSSVVADIIWAESFILENKSSGGLCLCQPVLFLKLAISCPQVGLMLARTVASCSHLYRSLQHIAHLSLSIELDLQKLLPRREGSRLYWKIFQGGEVLPKPPSPVGAEKSKWNKHVFRGEFYRLSIDATFSLCLFLINAWWKHNESLKSIKTMIPQKYWSKAVFDKVSWLDGVPMTRSGIADL